MLEVITMKYFGCAVFVTIYKGTQPLQNSVGFILKAFLVPYSRCASVTIGSIDTGYT